MGRLGLFILFLLIIGLLSSFYSPPAFLKINMYLYSGSSSPYCSEWMGTSLLINRLRDEGLEVAILDDPASLENELRKRGLLLIIAPDKPLERDEVSIIARYFDNGSINIGVFDETTLLNNLLSSYGVRVDNHTILSIDSYEGKYYFPRAVIYDVNGSGIEYRLNIASILVIEPLENMSYRTISTGYGVLDLNNNSYPDDDLVGWYNVSILFNNSKSLMLVFSDSYFVLNDALSKNLTASIILLKYISLMAREKSGRVIVLNYLYRRRELSLSSPFHITVLYMLAVNYLSGLEKLFTQYVLSNKYLSISLLIIAVLLLMLLIKYLLDIGKIVEYKPSSIETSKYVIGSVITGSLTDSRFLKGREKELILNMWSILLTTYRHTVGLDLDRIGLDKKYHDLARIGLSEDDVKKFKWLYKITRKIRDKTRLPIVVSWRRVLFQYINIVESYLNKMNYTILNKRGYRDVSRLIK